MIEYRQQRCPHGWVDANQCVECKKDVKIAELEAENARLAEGWKLNVEMLKQEVTRLQSHIRAIAEHHDQYSHTTLDWKVVPAWTNYHTARRDFALKVFDVGRRLAESKFQPLSHV